MVNFVNINNIYQSNKNTLMRRIIFIISTFLLFAFVETSAQGTVTNNTPTIYTNEQEFKTAIGLDYFVEEFNDCTTGLIVDSLRRSNGEFAYTVKGASYKLKMGNGTVREMLLDDSIHVYNRGASITAIGLYLYNTEYGGPFIEGDVAVICGSFVHQFTASAGTTTFIGLVFPSTFEKVSFVSSVGEYITLDHLYWGLFPTVVEPEPEVIPTPTPEPDLTPIQEETPSPEVTDSTVIDPPVVPPVFTNPGNKDKHKSKNPNYKKGHGHNKEAYSRHHDRKKAIFYPAPSSKGCHVNAKGTVTVYDASGKKVDSKNLKTNAFVSFEKYKKGDYIIEVQTEYGVYRERCKKK